MKQNNIYRESWRQGNPQNMSTRQQVMYLKEKTKNEDYNPDKDPSLVGKGTAAANDRNYNEVFEQEKRLAVRIPPQHVTRKREELLTNHPERLLMLVKSLLCFDLIRKTKYLDKRLSKETRKSDELTQSCACLLPSRLYRGLSIE